jgi:hypothetical protein
MQAEGLHSTGIEVIGEQAMGSCLAETLGNPAGSREKINRSKFLHACMNNEAWGNLKAFFNFSGSR